MMVSGLTNVAIATEHARKAAALRANVPGELIIHIIAINRTIGFDKFDAF
jgi:hypothetical protein